MLTAIDRVYDNYRARAVLGWTPQYTFGNVLGLLVEGSDYRSPLTFEVGVKGYHEALFHGEPYPVE